MRVNEHNIHVFSFKIFVLGIDPTSPPPTQSPLRDCADVRAAGHTESGVYVIKVGNSDNETSVYCDMNNSESWLVIHLFQRN